ncbi:MAG: hypothetical protein A3I88_03295 [Candidatus Portnoybacteria bacterium RIFCSPLOWO2_12_FULL_39_9]|uniref:Cell division protein FtsL n=1 Tax=Candidatus Portnoybacteria bacterium RIFCSPHIGHO2_12_FULL_38_9 TaxID=1801997 RepID=A0A1G2FF91_9BACT|nr:MAG: hypothetical protein A2646_00900 [Candidatus Portnoybacteria bacterium RIFCSPHIGHO2_02_FULL_39_12]OGZ36746.1 MAG: hypothetical protein A3J64_03400 [Candidatus Portnoybacteria bacterium RIFCSPHIGHO2_12_FULL_38_9]OGZ38105.1 MAG: hypothetical protein A3F21_01000 [Candidatus Portnoybacteria bacterium RIFCSPLOWO2_01_FULL_38_39]OGZ40112.1 MAG: hypothetical protein A3I88_03295 [Candidatus Portnoybacteria bacterium RIFCSPLOWO2_12_FULL_39_9]
MTQQAHHKNFIRKLLGSKIFLFLVALALIWLTLGVGRESYRKYQITKEINALRTEISKLEGDNQRLDNLIKYFQDPSYLEKEARIKLNLKKPGEKVVVAPEGSLAQAEQSVSEKTEEIQSFLSSQPRVETANWWKWWEYFFQSSPNL